MLRVTVDPRPHWALGLTTLGVYLFFVSFLLERWSLIPTAMRVVWTCVLVSSVPMLVYQFLGEEIIEFDTQKMTIRKRIHGWEHMRQYQIESCKELKWEQGRSGRPPGLRCKVGWRPIRFGPHLSERDANEILSSLQRTLPEVAQKICAHPVGR